MNKHPIVNLIPDTLADPAHKNEFKVAIDWSIGDADDHKSTLSYVPESKKDILILRMNWLNEFGFELEDMDYEDAMERWPVEFDDYDTNMSFPMDSSSCMLYGVDKLTITFFDDAGVERPVLILREL